MMREDALLLQSNFTAYSVSSLENAREKFVKFFASLSVSFFSDTKSMTERRENERRRRDSLNNNSKLKKDYFYYCCCCITNNSRYEKKKKQVHKKLEEEEEGEKNVSLPLSLSS